MRIRELREERTLSQEDVAKAIGTNQRNIGRWEKNENEPTSGFLLKLADFFECSVDYLLGRSDDFGNISLQANGAQLTQDEERLLKTYRQLNTKNKMHVSAYAQVRLEEQDGGAPSSLRWK